MEIVFNGGSIVGVSSWASGFVPLRKAGRRPRPTFADEARKNPEEFIQKLMDQGRWAEAEIVMDYYLN